MNRPAYLLLMLALMVGLVLPAPAFAGDEETPVPGPRNLDLEAEEAPAQPKPEAKPEPRSFNPANFELLPLDDVERLKLARDHPTLATRLTVLANRGKKLQGQYYRRKNKNDDGSKKLQQQIRQLSTQIGRLMAAAEGTLTEYGITPEVLDLVETAPRDGHYRVQRYAHSLVLSIDLDDDQRALFERIVAEVNGATYALAAQRKRLDLALKQTEVDTDKVRALRRTFDQQLNWNDRRFWMLVDYVLTDDQRFALKERLPTSYQRIQNGLEHLYQLEGITPSQGARATALVTEFEAEAAPDQALVKKNQQQLKSRDVKGADRKALREESKAANERLQELQLSLAKGFKTLLTEEQIKIYKAIPPRLSHVDRRRNFNYVFDGMPFGHGQQRELNQLKRKYRSEQQAMQRELAEIRRKGSDFGADSPQMEMMQMEMAGVAAKGYAIQRRAIGHVFLNVLAADQVSGWVLGYYGKVR
ncbi:MAG: hypothetical protein QNJ98_04675 [Planctomycetota bacterium]|nr:hypothetical protein [Planctomycetota bacterium]